MKQFFLCILFFPLFLFVICMVGAQENGANKTVEFPSLGIGQRFADFPLVDLDGKARSLFQFKGEKGTLVVFISVSCPYSNAYNERMEKVAQDYKAKGISFVGINANAKESPEAVKAHATEHHFTFPILKDQGNKLADLLGANVTPETFLFDTSKKLIYHGRIDNSKNLDQVKSHDLRVALDAHLDSRPIEKPFVKAFGCTIQRVK